MPVIAPSHFELMAAELRRFADPDNPTGFYRHFVFWVIRNWQSALQEAQPDCVHNAYSSPVSTPIPFYRDFITYQSDSLYCFTMEDALANVFASACADALNDIAARHQIRLPQYLLDENPTMTVAEAVFAEAFDPELDGELLAECQGMIDTFGGYGDALMPYLCQQYGPGPDDIDDGRFGGWTLTAFRRAALAS